MADRRPVADYLNLKFLFSLMVDFQMKKKHAHRDYALYLAARFFLLWPESAIEPVSRHLLGAACLASARIDRYRALARRNIETAFPDLGQAEKRRILQAAAGRLALDFHRSTKIVYRLHRVKKEVEIDGAGHLDRALPENKGVILISAHLGNFPLMIAALSRRGYPLKTIIRDFRNPFIENYFARVRARAGIVRIPRHPTGRAMKESLGWLRRGGVLLVIADQYSRQGVPAPFFGRSTRSPGGPAMLSRKTGAPVLPVSIRKSGKKWRVEIEPEIKPLKSGNREKDLVENTAAFNRVFEKWIRRSPADWSSWLNERFPEK